MTLVRAENSPRNSFYTILAVELKPNWFERLFGERHRVAEYHGGGTVWHERPKMIRQPTCIESRLSDLEHWWKYEYGGKPYRYEEIGLA